MACDDGSPRQTAPDAADPRRRWQRAAPLSSLGIGGGGACTLLMAALVSSVNTNTAGAAATLVFSPSYVFTQPCLVWGVVKFTAAAKPYTIPPAPGGGEWLRYAGLLDAAEVVGASDITRRIVSDAVDYDADFPSTFGTFSRGDGAPGSLYMFLSV